GVALVKTNNDTNTPNFAESSVPAVVGETNLFLLSCCIIRPAILMLAPAISILINLGNLLMNNISAFSSVRFNKSVGERSETPRKIDDIDNTISIIIKYRSFMSSLSLFIIILIWEL